MSAHISNQSAIARPCLASPWILACGLLLSLVLQSAAVAQEAEIPELDLQYVPAHQLEAVLRSDHPGVQLSASEFEELLRRAAEETQRRQGAPLTVTLKNVLVDARIQGDQLHAEMTVSAESFVDGWTTLDIPLSLWGVNAASESRGDDEARPAAISRRADNPVVVTWLLHGQGNHRLVLDVTATLTAAGNDAVVNVGLPAAPTGTFAVHLPPRRFLELDGERVDRPGDIEAESVVEIPIGQRSEIPLRFTDRISVNLSESLTLATTTINVGVTPSQVRWTATTDLSVFGSGLDRLECVIPGSLEVTQVSAEGLQAWELSDADMPMNDAGALTPTTITLQFRQPIQGSRRITFEGVLGDTTNDNQGWQVPTLTFEGVSSHVGFVAVDVATGLRLKTLETGELRTIEPGEFPQAVDASHTYLFQFWDQEFDLILATLPREREVHVAMTNIVEIGNEGLSLVSAVAVTPLFESMFDVEIVVPAEWSVVSTMVDGSLTSWQNIPRAAGEHVLRIPFATPATPGVTKSIQINAYRLPEVWPIQDASQQLSLPAVELPAADVVEAVYGVVCDPSLEVQTVDLEGLDPASQVEIDQINARLAPFGKSLTLGFVYQNSHFTGDINLSRRTSQMFVDITSLVELQGDRAVVYWRGSVHVEGGGLKQLQVSVPADAGTDVRFALLPGDVPTAASDLGIPELSAESVPRIVQQTLSDPVLGRRTWTLELDRRLIGRAELTAVFQFPKPEPSVEDTASDTVDADATNDADADPADDTTAADDATAADTDADEAAAATDEAAPDDAAADDSADATATEEVADTVEDVTQRLRSIYVVGAVRTSSIVAVIGREEQHLQVEAESGDGRSLRVIDPIDVPLGDPVFRPRMVASYQSANPEWVLSLSEDRLPGEAMPTVVFDQLRLASLLGRAGEGQHQAVGQIRAVGIQGLRITLPEGSELWSVALDGRPIEVRNETSAVFLAWPSSSTADEVHTLEITWMTTGDPFASMATVEQIPPAFEAVTGAGDVVHVELLQQTWELMHPEEAMLVSNHGEFKPTHALEVSSLLSTLPRAFAWPTGQEMTQSIVALCLLVVVVSVVIMIVRNSASIADADDRNSLRNLGWAAGVLAVVIVFVVIMLPAVQSSREAARRMSATSETAESYSAIPDGSSPASPWASSQFAADGIAESYDAEMDEFGGGGFAGGMGGFDGPSISSGAEFESAEMAANEPMMPPQAEMPFDAIDRLEDGTPSPGADPGQSGAAGDEISRGGRGLPEEVSNLSNESAFRSEESMEQRAPFGVQPELNIVGRDEWPDRTIAGLAAPNTFSGDLDVPFRQGSFDLGSPPFGGYQESLAANGTPAAGTPVGGPGTSDVTRARGALLSLPISIVVPPRTSTTSFEYVGAQSDTSRTRLSVSYVDRQLGQIITWAAAALILLWMWLLRSAPVRTKVILALALPTAVIALARVVPGTWHVVLDGLLIGSLAGLGLWTLVGLVNCCCNKCCAVKQSSKETTPGAPQATALLLLGLFGLGSGTHATADDLLPPTRVIVPYESLEELEQEGVSRVIIPRDDFWRLWNAAHPELEDVPPPAAALVTRADFAAQLTTSGPSRVSVTATFEILALSNDRQAGASRPRVVDIPLPLGQVPVNSSMLDDEPANVVLRDGRLVLLLPRDAMADGGETAQRHQLTIEFDLPSPGASTARGDFTLPLLSPSSGLVTFALPRPSDELELLVGDGREAFELIETDDGEALRISSALKPSTRFSWQVREMRGNLESTVHADAGIAIVAGRQGLSVRHAFQVRVLQGTLSEISMTLPASGRLQQIVGGDVVGWQYDQENAEPELTIFFRSGIEQSTSFSVDLFQPLSIDGATTVDVPLIALQGVSREAGVLAIYPQDDLTARSQGLEGLRQINIDQFTPVVAPTLPSTAASQAFRFVGEAERALQLVLQSRSQESMAYMEYGVRIAYRKLLVTARARLTPSANPRRSVLVELPADFLLTSVSGPTVVDWFETRTADGVRRLQLDLVSPQSTDVEILLDGNLPRDVSQTETRILLPRVLDVDGYSSELAVWVDDAFEPGLTELGDWDTKDRQQLSAQLRSLAPTEPWLLFVNEDAEPAPVVVQLDRGMPRLRAASVTLVAVTETGVDYGFTFQWDVSQAAADTFVVRLPSWLSGARFEVPGLRQLQTTNIGADIVEFRMQLVEPVTGRFLVSATASLPFPENDQVLAPVIDCRDSGNPPSFELAGQLHHAMVVNLSRSRIVPDPNAEIETVGRDDVAIVLREELVQQAMAIVRVRENGPAPVWNIVTAASQQISSDMVLQAELTTLLEMDGTWRTQATYTIRNQGHQFLAVKLPADSRVLSVMVRGQAGRTFGRMFGEQPVHLIPLPATSAAELSYQVVLTTEGSLAASLPTLFDIMGDDLEIPLPLVVSLSESTEFGLPVGQLLWTIHLPDEVVAEPVTGSGETNLTRHDRSEFLEQSLAIGISNYATESEELIQMATDEQISLAQRQQALASLGEINRKLENWYADDGATAGIISSELADEQNRLLMGNSMVIEQNFGLLQTDAFSQSFSQQDIGRLFCASNGAVILGDNRPASIAAGGVIESFGFAERGEATATETRTQGRAALRDQAQSQSLDFSQTEASGDPESILRRQTVDQMIQSGADPFQATLGLIVQQTQSVHHDIFPVELGDSGTQGGLSLSMPLPLRGDQLSFSRVDGDGKLVLRFRPTTTLETGLGWAWALVWGIAIVWSVVRITRQGSDLESSWNAAACPMIILGLLAFLLLGDPARWVGFTLLSIGFITWAWKYRHPTPVSRPEV